MKIAISVPDEVFAAAERFARDSGRSRSEVYATAVRAYVAHHAAADVTEVLDRVVGSLQGRASDTRFIDAAARRTLSSTER